MSSIPVKIFGGQQGADLQKRILRLVDRFSIKADIGGNFEDFLHNAGVRSYTIIIITDSEISRHRQNLVSLLKRFHKKYPKTQIILFVKEENIALAVETLKSGTYQYVKMPVSDAELKLIIEMAIDQKPQIVDKDLTKRKSRKKFGELIGGSTPMLKVYNQISQAAQTDIPVLILGETGTGKDMVANTIHRMSQRADFPYLAVNLGAMPSDLIASELFGHEKGSFTGAMRLHKGLFEQGHNGTVFLDEIDSMDEKVQVSLLRLLEQKKFKRLGGTRYVRSRARLIAASNEKIDSLVESGVFRTDLYYRLDVFRIQLPPLRERKNDIPLLLDELLLKYSRTYNKNISSISQQAVDALMNFDWPGNVRELKNVIQRAVLVCGSAEIDVEHLPPRFRHTVTEAPSITFKLGVSLREVEREMVSRALAATNNNRKRAAELLGISRRAIYNKLDKHNL